MTETGYSSESTKRELSNEYQHDRVKMVLIIVCILVPVESRISIGRVNPGFCLVSMSRYFILHICGLAMVYS